MQKMRHKIEWTFYVSVVVLITSSLANGTVGKQTIITFGNVINREGRHLITCKG